MAHALALDARESVADNATELTVTDTLFVPAMVEEFEEDDADQATVTELRPPDEAPSERAARLRARRSAVVDVRRSQELVPDPAAAEFGSQPAPDLELLVLQQDNVRLQRELELVRRELNALRSSIDGARRLFAAARWGRAGVGFGVCLGRGNGWGGRRFRLAHARFARARFHVWLGASHAI